MPAAVYALTRLPASASAPIKVCTACANAFAHGSNEVGNAVGPLAAIYQVRYGGRASVPMR